MYVKLSSPDNGNDHRAAAIDLQADKSRAARGSVCIVLLSVVLGRWFL